MLFSIWDIIFNYTSICYMKILNPPPSHQTQTRKLGRVDFLCRICGVRSPFFRDVFLHWGEKFLAIFFPCSEKKNVTEILWQFFSRICRREMSWKVPPDPPPLYLASPIKPPVVWRVNGRQSILSNTYIQSQTSYQKILKLELLEVSFYLIGEFKANICPRNFKE